MINHEEFNIEEKLFCNRIAFLIFKCKGYSAKFKDFIQKLTCLQDGNFAKKAELFFEMVDEDDNGIITLKEARKIFIQSFLQETISDQQIEEVLKLLFKDDIGIEKTEAI